MIRATPAVLAFAIVRALGFDAAMLRKLGPQMLANSVAPRRHGSAIHLPTHSQRVKAKRRRLRVAGGAR